VSLKSCCSSGGKVLRKSCIYQLVEIISHTSLLITPNVSVSGLVCGSSHNQVNIAVVQGYIVFNQDFIQPNQMFVTHSFTLLSHPVNVSYI
jgi:hypothetical protein